MDDTKYECKETYFGHITRVFKGGRTRGHRHLNDSTEIYTCVRGNGMVIEIVGNNRIEHVMRPDNRFCTLPNSYHYAYNTGTEDFVFATIDDKCEKDYTRIE